RPPVFAGAFTEASTPPPAPTGGLGPDSTLTIPSSSTPDLDAALEQLRGLSVYETLDEVLKKAGMPPLGS
ncbi:MAG: hypothetical protein QOK47_1325, partial [Actinomycetota bacterium]|nr:hypothetical protein [Actinomycetota bacterium]